jgi:hypothetical protein
MGGIRELRLVLTVDDLDAAVVRIVAPDGMQLTLFAVPHE